MAKMIGAKVIATTRSERKKQFLQDLGVDEVLVIADSDGSIKRFSADVKVIHEDALVVL